jgi:hypothetical protein
MGLRGALRKAAGLLVELPDETPERSGPAPGEDLDQRLREVNTALEQLGADPNLSRPSTSPAPAAKTVEQIVRDSPGPNLDQIEVSHDAPPPAQDKSGKIDYSPIYRQAKLPDSEFTAEQMLDMLSSLPAELPLETKRQTVKVTLNSMGKALGATPETIVADASRKLAALASYVESLGKRTADQIAKAQLEIASLQAQTEEKKKFIETEQNKQVQATKACEAESDRLDDVLEFFSLDVPPSKHAGDVGSAPSAPGS